LASVALIRIGVGSLPSTYQYGLAPHRETFG